MIFENSRGEPLNCVNLEAVNAYLMLSIKRAPHDIYVTQRRPIEQKIHITHGLHNIIYFRMMLNIITLKRAHVGDI